MKARLGVTIFAAAAAAACAACAAFTEGSTPETAVDEAGAPDARSTEDAGFDAPPGTCPPDAVLCHFFDGPLVQTKWQQSGNAQGTGLFEIATEGALSFGRASTSVATDAGQEDRLRATFDPPLANVTIDLDFRINTMPTNQILEVVGITYGVDKDVYHVLHITIDGQRAELSEFEISTQSYFRAQAGEDLTTGWHHAALEVSYAGHAASLKIDDAPPMERSLAYLPTRPQATTEILAGFSYAPRVLSSLSVDLDSIIVRGAP
jgi:hypothetical protein